MVIVLYKNLSEPNQIWKRLVSEKQYAGNFRGSATVINSTVTVATDDNLSGYNYCYIPDFGRYYFIKEMTIEPNKMWRFSCEVDVLYTYRESIKELKGSFIRAGQVVRTSLVDNEYGSTYNPGFRQYVFPYASRLGNYSDPNAFIKSYALTVMGRKE